MNEVLRIYWCKAAGTVYWSQLGEQDIFCAPMNQDNTADFTEGTIAEYWEDDMPVSEKDVRQVLHLDPR